MNHPNSRKLLHKITELEDGSVLMNGFRWDKDWAIFFSVIKFRNCNGYAARTGDNNKTDYLHRIILDCPADKIIDHRNQNRADNRRANLRIVDYPTNAINSKVSKNAGVCWVESFGKWKASLRRNYKMVFLGYFLKKKDARKAVDNFRKLTNTEPCV